MTRCQENAQPRLVVSTKACRIPGVPLLAVLLVAFWPSASAVAQSQNSPSQAQTSSQSTSQSSGEQGSQEAQATPALQVVPGAQQQTLGDAARQNAQKAKPKAKHVYSDDDLSSIGGTISVVGDGSSTRGSSDSGNSSGANATTSSASKDETYWRGKANAIKAQIADIDRQIDAKKDEIAKAGPTSFDPSTGLSQGVIIIHDRNAELKDLEDRKQSLENQLDQLADEGRKAGADSGWFR